MKAESSGLIIGISIGVVIGVLLAVVGFFCFRYHRKRSQIGNSSSRRAATIPIRQNGVDSCAALSDSSVGTESPRSTIQHGISFWLGGLKKANIVSASGILEYSYKYVCFFKNFGLSFLCLISTLTFCLMQFSETIVANFFCNFLTLTLVVNLP